MTSHDPRSEATHPRSRGDVRQHDRGCPRSHIVIQYTRCSADIDSAAQPRGGERTVARNIVRQIHKWGA